MWTKLALAGLPPWTLVFARQVIGIAFLFALARLGPPRRAAAAGTVDGARRSAAILLISWGGFALPQILLAMGAERSTAVAYALLTPLEPIGIVLGSALWLSEGLPRARAIGARARHAGGSAVRAPGRHAPRSRRPRSETR